MKNIYELLGFKFYTIGNPPAADVILRNKKAADYFRYLKIILWGCGAILVEEISFSIAYFSRFSQIPMGGFYLSIITTATWTAVIYIITYNFPFLSLEHIKQAAQTSPLEGAHGLEIVFWSEEHHIVKKHIQAINQSGRAVNLGDYYFLSQWINKHGEQKNILERELKNKAKTGLQNHLFNLKTNQPNDKKYQHANS